MMNTKIIPILILILTLSLIPQVYADSESDVNLMDLPKQLSERLGLPSSNNYFVGRILASLILLIVTLLPTIFACSRFNKDSALPSLIVGLTVLSFCVALGWFPVWTFIIIILVVAMMYGRMLADYIGGG